MIIQNTYNNSSKDQVLTSPFEGYTCIGSYEDKPTDCIYYFLHSEDSSGINGKLDCIVEYNHFKNKNTIVYQDGRKGSNGFSESVLNYSKSHLITGVNKVENLLYWTDNLNRPRKIDVEKGKKNELYIKFGPTFQNILKEAGSSDASTSTVKIFNATGKFFGTGSTSTNNTVLIGVSSLLSFKKNDILYLQQFGAFSEITKAYNGYSKAIGLVKPFSKGTTAVSVSASPHKVITGTGSSFLSDFIPGDYICLVESDIPYFYSIAEVVSDTKLTLTVGVATEDNSVDFNLTSFDSTLNTSNAIITDNPIQIEQNVPGGKVLHAQPDDAYSPLISYGERKDKIKYLDALAHQPKYKPSFEFYRDNKIKANDLIGNFFQFRYRYVYVDGSVSAYSCISDIAIEPVYGKNNVEDSNNNDFLKFLSNSINVYYSDDISYINKIEIVARNGNDGKFILINTINNNFVSYLKKRKNESLFITNSDYYGGINQTNIKESYVDFKNEGIYPFVSEVDIAKSQDALPKKAKAQTILSNNRLAYGNVVDGYDNTKIYTNLNIVDSDKISLDKDDLTPTFAFTTLGGPSTATVATLTYDLSSLDFPDDGLTKTLNLSFSWQKIIRQETQGENINRFFGRNGDFYSNLTFINIADTDSLGNSIKDNLNNNNNYILSNLNSQHIAANTSFTFESGPESLLASYNNNSLVITFTYNQDPDLASFLILPEGVNMISDSDGDNFTDTDELSSAITENNSYYNYSQSSSKFFKSGANHEFGLIYYDETNRSSFVNVSLPVNQYNTGTKAYSKFYSEKNSPADTSNILSWKIYNKPPVWATEYQWAYSGNTSIDEFIQIPIQNAYRTKDDKNILLGLGSLEINPDSYNETTSSVLKYNFVEGDRVRFISFGGDETGSESLKKYFKELIDVPIISKELYSQTELDDIQDTEANEVNCIEGMYLKIENPTSNAVPFEISNGILTGDFTTLISTTDDQEYNTLPSTTSGYHKLVVEIYRPKKQVSGDNSGFFYEVGDKIEVVNPGTISRRHIGQDDNFFFDQESGMEVTAKDTKNGIVDVDGNITTNYASGTLKSGDVYIRVRELPIYKQNFATEATVITKLNCEDYYINDFYNSNFWDKGRLNIVNNYAEERRLSASIYYSDVFSSTTDYNGLGSFDLAQSPYFDYNQDFGSIQSLETRNDELIIFHENRVGKVLVGKNVVNYADGDSNITLSKDVIKNYATVYASENGCSLNPESIIKNNNNFYFVDIKRGSVLRLGADGITKISDNGIKDYIRDKGELYVAFDPETSTNGEFKIAAGYDPKYDEYIITLPAIINKDNDANAGLWGSEELNWGEAYSLINNLGPSNSESPVTIAFSEELKKWTSFYTYFPEFYAKINRQFVSFRNGNLYKQNSPNKSNFNTFYGVRHRSSLEFPFNEDPSSVKTYNSISIEGDTKLLTNMSTNMGQHNNSYEATISTNIGFKKVGGSIYSETNGTSSVYLYGDIETNFYKDLSPGDLIRIYSTDSENPQYNAVKGILTKNKIIIDSPTSSVSINNRLEVIDYKTKEGVQYSQIPFAPSKTSSYNESNEFNYHGDASNVFGLGLHTVNSSGTYNYSLDNTGSFAGSPFMGNKSIKVSEVTPGAHYGILTLSNDFDYSEVFNVVYPSSTDILGGKGSFITTGDWTPSDQIAQSSLTFITANSEVKTTANLDFLKGSQYKVSFSISPSSDNDSNNATVLFKLGGGGQYYDITVPYPEMLVGSVQTVVLNSSNVNSQDLLFCIKSGEATGGFVLSSLTIEKITVPVGTYVANNGTNSSSESYVYPAEYKLYSMDIASGDTNHEGFVYNITSNSVKFKGLTTSSNYNIAGQKFFFIVKEGLIDGEKLKGHYLKTTLSSHWYQSKYKFNLYSANADLDKSELSNR